MEAKELRIGNYVYNGGIISLDIERLYAFNECLYDLQPIPITEEWLLKLGFEKEEGNLYSLYVDDNLDVSLWSDTYFSNPTIELTCNGKVVCKNIKYIHQLQNLYFALTGQELKLKINE